MNEFQIPTELGKKTLYFKGYDLIKIGTFVGVLLMFFVVDMMITKSPGVSDFIIPAIVAGLCLYQPYGQPYPLSLLRTIIYVINNHKRVFFTYESKMRYDYVIDRDDLFYVYGVNAPKYHYDKSIKNNVIDEYLIADVYDKEGYRLRKNIKLNLPPTKNTKKKLVYNLSTIPFKDATGQTLGENLNIEIVAKKSTKKELKAKENDEQKTKE